MTKHLCKLGLLAVALSELLMLTGCVDSGRSLGSDYPIGDRNGRLYVIDNRCDSVPIQAVTYAQYFEAEKPEGPIISRVTVSRSETLGHGRTLIPLQGLSRVDGRFSVGAHKNIRSGIQVGLERGDGSEAVAYFEPNNPERNQVDWEGGLYVFKGLSETRKMC